MVSISVIITTFGKPVYLEKAISSVLNQTFKDYELIVVDDNNPNSAARKQTEQLITNFNTIKIKYIKHQKNLNGAAARNTGFSVAEGKYVSLLDNDDEYMPDRLAKCYNLMELQEEGVSGVYTGCEFRRRGKKYSREINIKSGNFLVKTLACNFRFCTGSNFFMRKNVVDELNGFDISFVRHQDYDFLVRFFLKKSIVAIPEVLVIKNEDGGNLPDIEKMIEVKKQYLNKYKKLINDLSIDEQNYIYHTQFISVAEAAIRSNKINLSKEYYSIAKKYNKLTIIEMLRRILFCTINMLNI